MGKQEIICDFENGIIYRKKPNGNLQEVGSKYRNGYLRFGLNRKKYLCHRYLYEQYHGIKLKPEEHINHLNHVRTDNRIDNLEIVSHQQNIQYQQIPRNNTSGYKGVYFDKNANKLRAQIHINNKNTHLGY